MIAIPFQLALFLSLNRLMWSNSRLRHLLFGWRNLNVRLFDFWQVQSSCVCMQIIISTSKHDTHSALNGPKHHYTTWLLLPKKAHKPGLTQTAHAFNRCPLKAQMLHHAKIHNEKNNGLKCNKNCFIELLKCKLCDHPHGDTDIILYYGEKWLICTRWDGYSKRMKFLSTREGVTLFHNLMEPNRKYLLLTTLLSSLINVISLWEAFS